MEGNPKQNADVSRTFLDLLEQNPNRLLAAVFINELVKRGITQYYLSPGHRNAPLIAAIHHHPHANMESVIDERSAGYRALGYAAASEQCPALICTSGTAPANYYPALIEAWASDLPMLVISADRPPEQVAAGGNQTIHQPDLYGRFAPCWNIDDGWKDSLLPLSQQLDRFLKTQRPCHINIPFEEPLGGEQVDIPTQMRHEAQQLLNAHLSAAGGEEVLESAKIERFLEELHRSESPLIVVGEIKSLSERQSLLPFLREVSLPCYLDITSGLKYQFPLDNGIIPGFEHPEVSEYLHHQVDTVLHIGGRVTSRNYYLFLKNHPEIDVLNVSSSRHQRDPSGRTRTFLRCPPERILPQLMQRTPLREWDMGWVDEKIQQVSQGPLSFPQISKIMVEIVPEGAPLFLGNSTAIRSFDNYLSRELKKDIPIHYNRGVSGIEGHIASAQGIAEGSGKMTTLVLGDVSFIHDLSSLLSVPSARPGLIIVLVNDGGGGIFQLLPIAEEKSILPYMVTPHSLQFEQTARQFDLPYRSARNGEELIRSYRSLLEQECGLLEILLEPQKNLEVYRRIKTLRSPHVLP